MTRPAFNLDAKYILVTGDTSGLWPKLLAYSGLEIQSPQGVALDRCLEEADPHLWLVDVECDQDLIGRVLAAINRHQGDDRPAVIALVPSRRGAVAGADLRTARDLGADEFIISESMASAIAARIQFALQKGASDFGPRDLPESFTSQVSFEHEAGARPRERVQAPLLGLDEMSERLQEAIEEGRDTQPAALIVVNLDRFQRISTRYGRERGDDLLVTTLMRIRAAVNAALSGTASAIFIGKQASRVLPIVGRLQADEFAVILPALSRREDAGLLAQEILESIAEPLNFDGRSIYLSASAGIAFAPQDARDSESLLRAAHSALHHAQQRAGNSWAFYAPHLAASQAHRLEIEHRLREAMTSGELELYYQPQALVSSRDIIGIEALLRWRHPDLGLVSPDSFIGIAEEAGITAELGQWAVSTAIREIAALEAKGLPPLRLSINVSADMLTDDGGDRLPGYLVRMLDEVGMAPERLTLEITERTIIDEASNALAVIDVLKSHGVRMALDDFGTGYSSLSYLKTLPIDELKIDRSFILGVAGEDKALLRAIISMAKTLSMTVTAEGVETVEQLSYLAEEGCDFFQGYLCAPPLPGDKLLELMAGRLHAHG